MYNIEAATERIERLANDGTLTSLRYAILEIRFALEATALNRLSVSRPYLSSEDLKKWKPKEILDFLVNEVDAKITQQKTISIAETLPPGKLETAENYEQLDWKLLGTQSELDVRNLSRLWHKSSSFLHLDMENRTEQDLIQIMEPFVERATNFLLEAYAGNLVFAMLPRTLTFECDCGTQIKRNAELLKEGMIINCPNPRCEESFSSVLSAGELILQNRGITFACPRCSVEIKVPGNMIDKLRGDQRINWHCHKCDQSGFIKAEPKLYSKKRE